FGILVLEIVTGQKNNSFQNGMMMEDLLSHAWKSWRDGTASTLIDPTLSATSIRDMMRCLHIGLLCVQEDLNDRPNMSSVVLMLSSISLTLPVPSEPAFFMHSTTNTEKPIFEQYSSSTSDPSHLKSQSTSSLRPAGTDDVSMEYKTESLSSEDNRSLIQSMWGHTSFDYVLKKADGKSGGIIAIWDTSMFNLTSSIIGDGFVALMGKWPSIDTDSLIVVVYAPLALKRKKKLWLDIGRLSQPLVHSNGRL
ncbi:cysteine-rich receptor-like protein kinase 15, partial [Tanacetum coccineum]